MLNKRQADNVRENAQSLAGALILQHSGASIYLARLVKADYRAESAEEPALFSFARWVADELGATTSANEVYRAMLKASGVEL